MQKIDQKIKGLQEEINIWTSLLKPHMVQLRRMDTANYKQYILVQGFQEDDVSAEFALESLITAYGRLQDVILAGNCFWPHRKDDFEKRKTDSMSQTETIIRMLRDKIKNINEYDWAENFILKRTGKIEGSLDFNNNYIPDPEELFLMVHRWRRVQAKAAAFDFIHFALKERLGAEREWIAYIQDAVKKLKPSDRIIFRDTLRRYLASEFMFPWLANQYDRVFLKYGKLFMLAELEDISMQEYNNKFWDDVFGHGEMNNNTRGVIIGIIERIANALRAIGNYDELVEQIVWGGGSNGAASLVGSSGRVNIIPTDDKDGQCCEILLAFARGKHRRNGLTAIMRQVREHMIRCNESTCKSGQPTRIAIIFTDLWDKEIFAESIGDLKAHRDSGPGKIIMGALVNKDQITPQAII